MADVLTHLRELSVALFFFYKSLGFEITPKEFLEICQKNIINCDSLSIKELTTSNNNVFTEKELLTINNGFKLAQSIKELFKIDKPSKVIWIGRDCQSGSTIDLIINDIRFSLKEDSFIIENMGLYKLINLITSQNKYNRGFHIFENFAMKEFLDWFNVTRDLLIELGPNPFEYETKKYFSKAKINSENTLLLSYIEENKKVYESIISYFKECDYEKFCKNTISKTREKGFSKWLKEKVEKQDIYQQTKYKCAVTAGENLVTLLKPHIQTSPDSLPRLFRVENEQYYYAKSTSNITEIYLVPNINEFKKKILIKDICYKVPESQLNIHTTIQNTENDHIIEFRNELRYSHGQFNGTPEAKFYISEGSLNTIYELIYKS